MKWFNVSLLGLRGKCHPLLNDVTTGHEVKKLRCQLKMLCGDLFTFSIRANQSGGSPHCRLCLAPVEDLPHVISSCPELEEPRQSVTNGLEKLLVRSSTQDTVSISGEEFERLVADDELFTQFVVDPTGIEST